MLTNVIGCRHTAVAVGRVFRHGTEIKYLRVNREIGTTNLY